ncbi:MAG: TonB-dependent receptor plug domain-containing protein [Bacteroidetes bacterium]|nr:TonB-dependent receptor plug domain-containing protein [Bacteroidota bacterium]
MKKFITLCCLILCSLNCLFAQKKHTISGYVSDIKNGEMLIGSIISVAKQNTGTATNAYGFYSITLAEDSHYVLISFVGYKPQLKKIFLGADLRLNITLEPQVYETKVVGITVNKKARENINRPKMGIIDIPVYQIKELPAIFGEKDLLKVLQLLPGVQSGSEGSAGFYVRGGGPDQNLILLDEAIIYNPFHLAGFFSTFNGDAIKSVSLIKGGFPAQYGGRLSSIIDISMKDGNDKEYHGEGGVGLISSRLMLEGPIQKDKSSFMISGRRTYLDILIKPFLPKGISAGYYFYDLNGKVNYKFSDKDKIYLSSYLGSDVFSTSFSKTSFKVDWGNKSIVGRWNHLFNSKLFSNTTLIYNDYVFSNTDQLDKIQIKLQSGIRDYTAKMDFDWFPHIKHKVKFGATYTYQQFIPSSTKLQLDSNTSFSYQIFRYVHTSALYINDEFTLNENISMNFGLRAPLFIYKKYTFYNAEPRFTFNYIINKNSSVKLGYAMMHQFTHLVSNSSISLPTDIWVPSSDVVLPQVAQQVALGYFRNFNNDAYETSVEVYYKNMTHLIEYKEGAQIFLNPDVEKEFVYGSGYCYGTEFFVKRNEGKITGWIGYTLAWAYRTFPDLNNGKTFPSKYDQRHNVSVAGVYKFNKELSFSTVFVFGSGQSLTLPVGQYQVPMFGSGFSALDYNERNSFKLYPYHRMDIGIKYTLKIKSVDADLRLDVYNVYNRRNPYFIYLQNMVDPRSGIEKPTAVQVSLFPTIPTFTVNFKF